MPGGNHFCENTVVLDGDAIVDVIDYTSELGAEFLRNRADGRKYPQKGCTVNHSAVIGFTTLNLTTALQTGASAPLLGSTADAGIVLTVDNEAGGSVVHTLSPAECIRADQVGGHAKTSEQRMAWEAVGEGGTEPTVTWATAA